MVADEPAMAGVAATRCGDAATATRSSGAAVRRWSFDRCGGDAELRLGLPPLAHAFANAIAKLTGKTPRELPLKTA
jgi:hypothetical protein